MKVNICESIANDFIKNEIITTEDKELYVFGLQQGLILLLNIFTTILIGFVLGMLWQSVLFFFAYMPLRIFSGGYHAKTQFRCYICSVLLATAVLLVIKLITWTSFICMAVALLAGIIILLLAPVEDRNKPLDSIEINVYRKRAHIILGIEVITLLLFMYLGYMQISICISTTLAAIGIMLLFGKLKNLLGKP